MLEKDREELVRNKRCQNKVVLPLEILGKNSGESTAIQSSRGTRIGLFDLG
jgi:hypothetical protein